MRANRQIKEIVPKAWADAEKAAATLLRAKRRKSWKCRNRDLRHLRLSPTSTTSTGQEETWDYPVA